MTRHEADEAEIEASRAPLMDHLIELRGRLVICVVAFILAFFVCFAFAEPLYIFLVKPFAAAAAFRAELDRIESALREGDRDALMQALARGERWRSAF